MARIPRTNTVVSYAYTVKANGVKVGTLQGFNPSYNRGLYRVREIMGDTHTYDTVEIIPNRGEITLRITRLELYASSIMQNLGFAYNEDLSQITDPITIVEELKSGTGQIRTIEYVDCWAANWTKQIQEGTVTVNEDVELWPTRIEVTNP